MHVSIIIQIFKVIFPSLGSPIFASQADYGRTIGQLSACLSTDFNDGSVSLISGLLLCACDLLGTLVIILGVVLVSGFIYNYLLNHVSFEISKEVFEIKFDF